MHHYSASNIQKDDAIQEDGESPFYIGFILSVLVFERVSLAHLFCHNGIRSIPMVSDLL